MKVIFHKLFPYAPYLNEYIGMEHDFPDTLEQDIFDGYVDRLREMTEANHKKKYPHLYNPSQSLTDFNTGQPAIVPTINKEAERTEILIDNSQSIEELNKYSQAAANYNLVDHWTKRHDELKRING